MVVAALRVLAVYCVSVGLGICLGGGSDDDIGVEIQGRRCTVSRDARTVKVPKSSRHVFALEIDVNKLAALLSV